jgi:hypothetical protein
MRFAILAILLAASVANAEAIQTLSGSSSSSASTIMTSAVTCTDSGNGSAGALTLDVTCASAASLIIAPLTNSDADGCAVTMAETSATVGCTVIIELVSSAGGTVTLADVANVVDVDGSWTPSVADVLLLVYEDLSNDRWQESGRNKACNTAGCTMTGGVTFSGVTTDITAASTQDVIIAGGATSGSVVIQSIDEKTPILDSAGNTDMQIFTHASNASVMLQQGTAATTGAVFLSSTAATIGTQASANATTVVARVSDGMSDSTAGASLHRWFGAGFDQVGQQQSAACAAGVLALDPTSSVVYLDANGAACAVTLAETSVATAGAGIDVLIVVTTSAGAGTVTFPNVANIHAGPAACTTTGIAINDTYRIHYADAANDLWVGVACTDN